MRCYAFLLRRWQANTGRGLGAILAKYIGKAPLSGSFFVQAVMFTQANTTSLALSIALGSGGDPAWGAKKVGEKPSFSPRASGGVT